MTSRNDGGESDGSRIPEATAAHLSGSLKTSRRRIGCAIVSGVAATAVLTFLAALLIPAWRLPRDAPLARMYRTEAELAALVKALNSYYATNEAYPPAGATGLRMATDFLSRTANYMPQGPPTDGWDRPFVYVPSNAYREPESQAIRRGQSYCAPDTYQVYSLGADGTAGLDDDTRRNDNITSWEPEKPWRVLYNRLNREYLSKYGSKP